VRMTIKNVRGRIRRTCRAGGSTVACLLELPVKHLPEKETPDPHGKNCRDRPRKTRSAGGAPPR
jgi:hypothetical protein